MCVEYVIGMKWVQWALPKTRIRVLYGPLPDRYSTNKHAAAHANAQVLDPRTPINTVRVQATRAAVSCPDRARLMQRCSGQLTWARRQVWKKQAQQRLPRARLRQRLLQSSWQQLWRRLHRHLLLPLEQRSPGMQGNGRPTTAAPTDGTLRICCLCRALCRGLALGHVQHPAQSRAAPHR